jgi:hypothetical protein
MIHFEVITPKMRDIAQVISDRLDSAYYLAGGTALALLSGHRESVDLDYFIASPIDTEKLKATLLGLFPGIAFTYEEIDTLWCVIDGVKVSFISRQAPLIDTFLEEDGWHIASVKDLVAMKLSAVCGRDEYKDYYDLVELADLTDVREWPVLWGKVYPASDPIAWMTALSHVGSMAEVPLRGESIRSKEEVEKKMRSIVKELSPFV